MTGYDPSACEAKWQERWDKSGLHAADLAHAKRPYYGLVMFPYPSGDKLHVGHWYNFGPADSFYRFQRMRGRGVFTPIGFDAFGLPAENYAIRTGTPPAESTAANVATMIRQLRRMGCMYDWSRMVNTSEPAYYRWTQWLFLRMFGKGLAYRGKGNVNFCPSCQTVLANEQAQDGTCERCGTEVLQKPLEQWFWKITAYADRLLSGLDALDWPEKTKTMQRNWIGRKEGIEIAYDVEGRSEKIVCFTTRPDTNFGATFIVLAPEHPFVGGIIAGRIPSPHRREIGRYVEKARHKTERERQEEERKKTGAFTGFSAVNNLTGENMPIWVSDFVLAGFGTGAVVGVPGHDKRDFEFAREFGIPVRRVVRGPDGDDSDITSVEQVQEEEGTMVHSGFLDGLDIHQATHRVMDHLEEKGWGKRVTTMRLRDWLVSRQRYWGALIPIVYDPEGAPHPVPEEHLPWLLPTDVAFKPTGTSPIANSKELKTRVERLFGKGWTPEVDTMDTFVCSSFYQLMYLSTDGFGMRLLNTSGKMKPIDSAVEEKWMPVRCYIGGAEHACMHLIYARFVTMALHDMDFLSHEEPFKKLIHQGVITHKGAKMSKSKGNVVSPDPFVLKYGADVFRMYLMFMGPFEEGGDWNDSGIRGIDRFVRRVHAALTEKTNKKLKQDKELESGLHTIIKKVTGDMDRLHFNTAIAALMEFLPVLEERPAIPAETASAFLRLLAPLAPHLAEELWERTGGRGFILEQPWPACDDSRIRADRLTIVVQVNGKVRAEMQVPAGISEAEALALAEEQENVRKHLAGKTIRKAIYVPEKLVSLVV